MTTINVRHERNSYAGKECKILEEHDVTPKKKFHRDKFYFKANLILCSMHGEKRTESKMKDN